MLCPFCGAVLFGGECPHCSPVDPAPDDLDPPHVRDFEEAWDAASELHDMDR